MNKFNALIITFLFVASCKKDIESNEVFINAPVNFPVVVEPEGNKSTKERFELGRMLFYDPILSIDSTISCSNCHEVDKAFATNKQFDLGVDGRIGRRNAPSLGNIGLHPYFTREGGVATLEQQVLVPIQEHNEMDFNILDASVRIGKNKKYATLCSNAYPGKPFYYAITNSLAVFERAFISNRSLFDAYFYQKDRNALNSSEIRGMNLFYGVKTNCSQCHNGANFTNYAFEHNGLYETYSDLGRYRLTKEEVDRERFKVASLRNVELTAPYMHDGSLKSLEEVVEHYNNGGKQNPNKSKFIQKLHLSNQEKEDLINFLKTLTDDAFVKEDRFNNPFH